jgi:hypothetical protein
MAHDVVAKRPDWLEQPNASFVYEKGPSLHSFVGGRSGGVVTNHGEFCLRVRGDADGRLLRFLPLGWSRDDDDSACAVSGVFQRYDTSGEASSVGVLVKAQSACSQFEIVCVGPGDLVAGDNFLLKQKAGATLDVRFWLDLSGSYVPPGGYDATNVRVDVSAAESAVDVAYACEEAINTTKATLLMYANADAAGRVWVTNKNMGETTTDDPETVGTTTATKTRNGAGTVYPYNVNTSGYVLFYGTDTTNRFYLKKMSEQHLLNTFNVSAVHPSLFPRRNMWIGLKLTATKIGNDLRLRGYAMQDADNVSKMYIDPTWLQIFDVVHVNGSTTPSIQPISGVTQTTSALWHSPTPQLQGRCGFVTGHRQNSSQMLVSGVRVQRARGLL